MSLATPELGGEEVFWKIEEYDGLQLLGTYSAPGNLSRKEIGRILSQLAARHLTPNEVISANHRNGMRGKTSLLDIYDDNGMMMVGERPLFTARKVEEQP